MFFSTVRSQLHVIQSSSIGLGNTATVNLRHEVHVICQTLPTLTKDWDGKMCWGLWLTQDVVLGPNLQNILRFIWVLWQMSNLLSILWLSLRKFEMKIVKISYDQLLAKEKSYYILNHYRKLILQQSYDSLMINLKIFSKSGPWIFVSSAGCDESFMGCGQGCVITDIIVIVLRQRWRSDDVTDTVSKHVTACVDSSTTGCQFTDDT